MHSVAGRRLLLVIGLLMAFFVTAQSAAATDLISPKHVNLKVVLVGGDPSDVQYIQGDLYATNGLFDIASRGGTHWLSWSDKDGGPVTVEQVNAGTDACADYDSGVSQNDPISPVPAGDTTGYDVVLTIAIGPGCTFHGEGGGGYAGVKTERQYMIDHLTYFNATLMHEIGHAINFPHTNSWECPTSPGTDPWAPTCNPVEYGNPFDLMGQGIYSADSDRVTELTVLASDPEYMPVDRGIDVRSSQVVTLTRDPSTGHGAAIVPTLVADSGSSILARRGAFNSNAAEHPDTVYHNVFAQGIGFEPTHRETGAGTEYGITIRAIPFPLDLPTGSGGHGEQNPTYLFENQHPSTDPDPQRELFVPGDTFTVPSFGFAPYTPPIFGMEDPVGGPEVTGQSTMTITVVSADAAGAVVDVHMDQPMPARTETAKSQTKPDAPTGVSVGGVGGVAVASWTPPAGSGITGYDVTWSADAIPQPPIHVSGPSVTLGHVIPGAEVKISVQAENGGGLGDAASATGTVAGDSSDTSKPDAPASGAVSLRATSLIVNWAASTDPDVVGYRVRLGIVRDVTHTFTVQRSVTADTLQAPVLQLRPGTDYVLHVSAVDAAGNESDPTSYTVTTLGHYVAPVTNIHLTANPDSTVTVTWDRGLLGEEPTNYTFYWSTMIGGHGRDWPIQTLTLDPSDPKSYTFDPHETLTVGDHIFVQINPASDNAAGFGHAGSVRVPDPVPPATPVPSAVNVTDTTATITYPSILWDGNPVNYEITGIGATQLAGSSFVPFSGLTPCTSYTASVVAISIMQDDPRHSLPGTVSFTTTAPGGTGCGPTGPTNLSSPEAGAVMNMTTPMLFWESAANAASYTVFLDGVPQPATASASLSLSAPLSEGVHTWYVTSTGFNGTTTSAPRSFTVDSIIDTPAVITSPLNGAVITAQLPTFTWTAAVNPGSPIYEYQVFVDGQLDGFAMASDTSTNSWNGLTNGLHTAEIVAMDGLGNSIASDPVIFTVQAAATGTGDPNSGTGSGAGDTGTGGTGGASGGESTPTPVIPVVVKPVKPALPVNLTGGTKADKLIGNALANIINGGGGNDTLDGGAGNDTVHGGVGNDKVVGGTGKDKIYGDAGNDTLDGNDHAKGDVIDGGPGTDTCIYNKGDVVKNCEKKVLKK